LKLISDKKLQIIIINYRTTELLVRCVNSILTHKVATIQNIIIVENKSPDNSFERLSTLFPSSKLIAAPSNRGYGAGVNLGARSAISDYIVILNPDTYFESNSLSGVVEFLDNHANVGIVGFDLVNADGSRQFSARRFYCLLDVIARRCPFPIGALNSCVDAHLMIEAWAGQEPFDAEWVMGAGLVIRRDLFNRIGGMDERYILYMEDVDLCARVWNEQYRVVCIPGAKLVHDHQRASAQNPLSRSARLHLASLFRFGQKFRLPVFKPPGIAGVIK
jgi:N-acetylglucosaminyl-diphospho-decaprenol L-rhamnosyltransferase